MPSTEEDKRVAAKEVISILHEISILLVRDTLQSLGLIADQMR